MKTYSTSNVWKKLFERNKRLFKKNLENVKRVFTAFNTNIDYIVHLNDLPFDFKNVESNAELPNGLTCEEDLKKALVNALSKGLATELKVEDEDYYEELINEVKVREERMGGQMGIVANNLAELGVQEVIAYSNVLSEEQSRLFHENVLYPVLEEGGVKLKSIRECGSSNDPTRINLIIEYKQGREVEVEDGVIRVPRNNRFIISSPVANKKPVIEEELLKEELFENVDRVFLSGYHHVSEEEHEELFTTWVEQVERIKSFNPDLEIHIEYVDLHKTWLNQALFTLLNHVHSFGMNEVELKNLMKYLGNHGLGQVLEDSNYNVKALIRASEYLMNEFELERVSVHTLPYIICLTQRDYPISKEALLHSNIYAMRVVNSRGVDYENFTKELGGINEYELSREGMEVASEDYNTSYKLVVVPNFDTDSVPVEYTVGLGDTVSSAAFFSEEVI